MKIVKKSNGRNHWYVDADANDARVQGVTTTTGNGLPKPALINWAGEATAEYAVDNWDTLAAMGPAARLKALKSGRYANRDEAANRGRQVHKLGERLVLGEQVTIPPLLEGYVRSYVQFLDEFQVDPVHVEAVVYSETHRHVGTLDLIADLRFPDMPEYDDLERTADGFVRSLIDIKTTRTGIFGDTAVQLAPYRYSEFLIAKDPESGDEEVIEMPEVAWTGAVHVTPNGYELRPVLAGPDQYRDFLYIQQVARFVDTSRELVGEPVIPPTTGRFELLRVDVDPAAEADATEMALY
ncbi:hypothetical protein GA0070616_4402 [Micromonospora nigra]|uniref:Exonuclease n=1 Tax=Micromonospora nigra TaxID=145857 RepID=A0A1C6SSE6_9ACTN|nr:hypothetical protein [Micromonospora nigra]SCL32183.1 hypothetical protein GA0070616_4402 [Micromonospora nigra]